MESFQFPPFKTGFSAPRFTTNFISYHLTEMKKSPASDVRLERASRGESPSSFLVVSEQLEPTVVPKGYQYGA